MADFLKGGRGKRAPYQTVMYRIPAPIKPVVEILGHTYRLLVDKVDPTGESLIKRVENAIAATTGYEQPQIQKLQADEKNNDSDDESDNKDDDLDIDDDSEPSDDDVIKTQVKMIQSTLLDIKLCQSELAEVKQERSQLDKELNELHARNGDLNLEIAKLQEKLADQVKRSNSELEQVRSQLEIIQALEKGSTEQLVQCHRDSLKAAELIKEAIRLKKNKKGGHQEKLEEALELIDDI